MGKLTAAKIRSLTEPGRYSDGDGLFLEINGKGAASWILRIQNNGKRQDIGLGSTKSVSLKDARDAAFATRQRIAQGIDPVAERKQERQAIPTFREAAKLVHEEHEKAWKNGKHQNQWIAILTIYAFPKIGDLTVDKIEGPAIREVLIPIWLSKPETARRVRQRIGTVLDWACAKGFRATEAPMRSLSKGLPRQPKKDGHFAAMPYADVPAFVEKLGERESVGRLALEALILTATRSGEIRGATWAELDLKAALGTIPAARMKMGRVHIVPLSPQAVAVFERAQTYKAGISDLVFAGQVRTTGGMNLAGQSPQSLARLRRGHRYYNRGSTGSLSIASTPNTH
ncbi:DUF4102 domain-containing protein [Sphingomonas koreensis]|uniref:tyrosine-type recombinase/integrase n=1 Tax=Sphingomonas koreensis TaxID=93064 RepID=UPI0009FDC6CD|nr:integrase arm-type DNA-binding domain-containing protein [Sphingomonas koreensis]PJI88578.1 phage integrase family protein [Sphingomonas koreensis]RSU58908.1 DUF4102 domain-containing protein [Sphingomonas koreensis]RSU67202.1 DUF4102 domain-containing protein [Sphingomonas koreensis]